MSEATLIDARRELQLLADPARAEQQARYFRAVPGGYGEGDCFLGIRVPDLRHISRTYRALDLRDVLKLLASPLHEERLVALLILVEQYRRGTPEVRETIFRSYLANTRYINNWDLVDSSAAQIVGAQLDFPCSSQESINVLESLAHSASLWERRIAIIATFHWIRKGEFDTTFRIAELLLTDDHDLIHKAVGWMLREVGNRDHAAEEVFLQQHYRALPRTALRYAIEKFPEETRKRYLKGDIASGNRQG